MIIAVRDMKNVRKSKKKLGIKILHKDFKCNSCVKSISHQNYSQKFHEKKCENISNATRE